MDSKDLLVIAESDSQLKFTYKIAEYLEKNQNFKVTVSLNPGRNNPSQRQIDAAGIRGTCQYRPCIEWINSGDIYRFDVVVIALINSELPYLFSEFQETAERLGLEKRPILVTGFPGVVFYEHLEWNLWRAGADIICCNSALDKTTFSGFFNQLDLDPGCFVQTGVPYAQLGEQDFIHHNAASRMAPRSVLFAVQTGIPETRAERLYICNKLIEYARKHPHRTVVIKPRILQNEAAVVREEHHYLDLINAISEEQDIPANLVYSYEDMDDLLEVTDLCLSISSTALIEALSKGCQIASISDFGMRESLGTHFFMGSGILKTFNDIEADDFGALREDWFVANGGHKSDQLSNLADHIIAELNEQDASGRMKPFQRIYYDESTAPYIHEKNLNKFQRASTALLAKVDSPPARRGTLLTKLYKLLGIPPGFSPGMLINLAIKDPRFVLVTARSRVKDLLKHNAKGRGKSEFGLLEMSTETIAIRTDKHDRVIASLKDKGSWSDEDYQHAISSHTKLGQLDEALKLVSAFKDAGRSSFDVSRLEANIHRFKGDFDAEIGALEEALQAKKDPYEIRQLIARAMVDHGDRTAGFQYLVKLARDYPGMHGTLDLMVWCQENPDDFREIEKAGLRAVEISPIYFRSYLSMATGASLQGLQELAISYARKSLEVIRRHKTIADPPPAMFFTDDAARSALNDLVDLFEANNLAVFLISGTLLGAVRNGNFLSHDKDIDVGIFVDESNEERVRELLISNQRFYIQPFVSKHTIKANHVTGIYIDVFLHYHKNGKVWHGDHVYGWTNTPFELKEYDFIGRKYLGPTDYDRYLAENYGDWKTPKPHFDACLDTPNLEVCNADYALIHLYKRIVTYIRSGDYQTAKRVIATIEEKYGKDDYLAELAREL